MKKLPIKQLPKEERIVMTLGAEPTPAPRQTMVETKLEDSLAPTLVDEEADRLSLQQIEEEIADAPLVYFELNTTQLKEEKQEIKAPANFNPQSSKEEEEKKELERKKQALEDKFEALRQNVLGQTAKANPAQNPTSGSAAGGYLNRPSNIYNEGKKEASPKATEEPLRVPAAKKAQEEAVELHLIIRNDDPTTELPNLQAHIPKMHSEDTTVNEEEGQDKKRAADRLQKLRNLSFNLNAADPNNEYESVPAYLRRNMELQNNANSVENFYSNYSVKSDGKNNGSISTINTFLDGKKPD